LLLEALERAVRFLKEEKPSLKPVVMSAVSSIVRHALCYVGRDKSIASLFTLFFIEERLKAGFCPTCESQQPLKRAEAKKGKCSECQARK